MSDLGKVGVTHTWYGAAVVPITKKHAAFAPLSDGAVQLVVIDPDKDEASIDKIRAALSWRHGPISVLVGAAGAIVLAVFLPLLMGRNSPGPLLGAILALALWLAASYLISRVLDRRAALSENVRIATAKLTADRTSPVEQCIQLMDEAQALTEGNVITDAQWVDACYIGLWHAMANPASMLDGVGAYAEYLSSYLEYAKSLSAVGFGAAAPDPGATDTRYTEDSHYPLEDDPGENVTYGTGRSEAPEPEDSFRPAPGTSAVAGAHPAASAEDDWYSS